MSSGAAPRLVVVGDDALAPDELVARVAAALEAVPRGSTAFVLRDRARGGRALLALGERLAPRCEAAGAPFVVADRLDVALALGASGAHLGGRSVQVDDARRLLGPRALVSVAAHAPAEVAVAAARGATWALLSPLFASPGKGAPIGPSSLERARAGAGAGAIRLFALGGIDASNATACRVAGADGVAVIRAVLAARDPGAAASALLAAFDAAV